eukprot:scaffold107631_cov78-Phaeocystis_antarctica.AAC.2
MHLFGLLTLPQSRPTNNASLTHDSGDEHRATPPTLRPPSRVPSHGTRERGRRIETGAAEQAKRGAESRAALTKRGRPIPRAWSTNDIDME